MLGGQPLRIFLLFKQLSTVNYNIRFLNIHHLYQNYSSNEIRQAKVEYLFHTLNIQTETAK